MARKRPTYIDFPPLILFDSSEQMPYTFLGIESDAKRKYIPYHVRTKRVSLDTGDYSLEGWSGHYSVEEKGKRVYHTSKTILTIERKNPSDFISSLISGRSRFEECVRRMNCFRHAFIICEAELDSIYQQCLDTTKVQPQSILQTINSWQINYPNVHWRFLPGRRFAEVTTYRLMQFAYEKHLREIGEKWGSEIPF